MSLVNTTYSWTSFGNRVSSINTGSIQLSFINQVSLVSTQLLRTLLCLLSELGRHYLLNLTNSGMLYRHKKLSSMPEWARQALTNNYMICSVTSKTIHNQFINNLPLWHWWQHYMSYYNEILEQEKNKEYILSFILILIHENSLYQYELYLLEFFSLC